MVCEVMSPDHLYSKKILHSEDFVCLKNKLVIVSDGYMETDLPLHKLQQTGAENRARTGHLDLGKVALYQMSYFRLITISKELKGVQK